MAATEIHGGRQIKSGTIDKTRVDATIIRADGVNAFTANQAMGSNKITGLADGSGAADAVNKSQLDAAVAAIASGSAKDAVRVATTGNITLSGTQTVDDVALSAGDRAFVRVQADPTENGIRIVSAGAWPRSTDNDTWNEIVSSIIPVSEGTVNADTLWLITADRGGTLDTTAITSVQLPGPSDVIAGAGMTRTGQTINVIATDTSLTVAANDLGVAMAANGGLEISSGVKVKLDGATLALGAGGTKVASGGITGTELNASVAGGGLTGGGGSALAVATADTSISINADSIQVAMAANGGLEVSSGVKVKLDGSSLVLGAGGAKVNPAKWITRENPSGTINGANVTFTLAATPITGSESIYQNGLLLEGAGEDYTLTTNSIAFVVAPITGDRIRASYIIV